MGAYHLRHCSAEAGKKQSRNQQDYAIDQKMNGVEAKQRSISLNRRNEANAASDQVEYQIQGHALDHQRLEVVKHCHSVQRDQSSYRREGCYGKQQPPQIKF